MSRIYCDTNIYSIVFNKEHKSYTENLKITFEALKDIVIFPFSESHIMDLHNSSPKFRDKQLVLMEKFVKDNYFLYDSIKKELNCYLATPTEVYTDKDFESYNSFMANPFDVNNIMDLKDGDESEKLFKNTLDSIFNKPFTNLISLPNNLDAKSLEFYNKFFPQDENLSLGNFLNHTLNYGLELLNNAKEVTDLRNYVGSYINRNEYSFEKWGEEFDLKLKETSFNQTFSEIFEKTNEINNRQSNYYDSFILYYNLLELLNVTKEKSGGKTKKFNLSSLNTDANHAYYASMSDYLVTDDKGLQVKAFLAYKYFNIPTKILSSKDFANYRSIFLNQEEVDKNRFFDSLIHEINTAFLLIDRFDLETNSRVLTYNPSYHFFNFFDRFQTAINDEYIKVVLYRRRVGYLYRELEIIVNKLISLLGSDIHNKLLFNFESERELENSIIREWKIGKAEILLAFSENSPKLFITIFKSNPEEDVLSDLLSIY